MVAYINFLIHSAALGGDIAPPSPQKPWSPPGLIEYERELAQARYSNQHNATQIEIDSAKTYDLPELIDIAERLEHYPAVTVTSVMVSLPKMSTTLTAMM